MNLLLIIGAVFAGLFILVKVLEGRAQPMEPEQASQLSRWIMIAVAVLLLVQGLAMLI